MFASCTQLCALFYSFRADLVRLISPWGQERKYHETITRFWLSLAAHYLESQTPGRCLAAVANDFVERFGDKTLVDRHYSRAVLASHEARTGWVAPDLAPIA